MRLFAVLLLAASISLVTPIMPAGPAPVALAQEIPDLPPLGTVVLEDPMTERATFAPGTCVTGRNSAELVPDGMRMRVTGRCAETSPDANMGLTALGVAVGNGEVSIDTRTDGGHDRAYLSFGFRAQTSVDEYIAFWHVAQGRVSVEKIVGSIAVRIADTTLENPPAPGAWTRVAIRMAGPRVWILVNDEPVLSFSDPTLSRGGILLGTGRAGSVDDDAEVVVVWRNFRVTALASESAAP